MTHYVARYAATPGAGNSEWCQFVIGGAAGDIQIDNDGEMANTQILVDLSAALSTRLGKQMSQMSVYRISHIQIRLVNVNDGLDNESGANFGGRIHWFTPSKHRMDAMKIARTLERKAESIEVDADSFLLSTDKDYSGIRFDWDGGDYAGHTRHATSENFTGLVGSTWDLEELFDVYQDMKMPATDAPSNYLWYDGRCGSTEQIGWTASYQNSQDNNTDYYNPRSDVFTFMPKSPIEILSGMFTIDVIDSSVDSPFLGGDDDYYVEVSVGIEGWSDF